MTHNILLTGIGGQGTILASKLLTIGLLESGYDVKMSEVHGMSQRNGSVLTHVRYGERVYAPVVEKGTAEILVGFEELEVLRNLEYLKPDGIVVLNREQRNPIGVQAGLDRYPQNIEELIQSRAGKVISLYASEEAEKLGNVRVGNMVLLGALIAGMHLEAIDWDAIVSQNVKPAFVALNQKAIRRGMELVK